MVTQVLSLNLGGGGQPVHVTTYWVSQLTEEGCNTIRDSGTYSPQRQRRPLSLGVNQ